MTVKMKNKIKKIDEGIYKLFDDLFGEEAKRSDKRSDYTQKQASIKPIIEYWRVFEGFNKYSYFVKVPVELSKFFKGFQEIAEYRDPLLRVIAKQYKLTVDEMNKIAEKLENKAIFERLK